jgi:hypothetical protein
MEDFDDKIECNDDDYWFHVEGQLFAEDEFKIVDGVACPIFPTLYDF